MIRSTLVAVLLAGLIGRAEAQDRQAPPANAPAGEEVEARGPAIAPAPALPPLPTHQQSAPTPKSPPPAIALASWNVGTIYLRLVFPFAKSGPGNAAGPEANAPGGELASVAQPVESQGIKAQTADGKPVSQDALSQRLAQETPVLVGSAQLPPDPTYLRVVKGDTLVLLLPAPPPRAPAAPSGPATTPPSGDSGPTSAAPAPR